MSMVPVSSPGSLTDDSTTYTKAVASLTTSFAELTRPDSRPPQSQPSPQLPLIRPRQHGSTFFMPRYNDLAEWQRTVIRPVQKQFQPFRKSILVSILVFPPPTTNSAADVLSWFQRLEEIFQLVPKFSSTEKIYTMIAATSSVHFAQLQQFYDLLKCDVPDENLQYEQFKQYLQNMLLSEVPTMM
ncbi:unnamed protein product [Clavelina lepadiformis]|uniref:Gag protein n=1 Tax=Clavelina lepadiformis TaxID=159417 RepID=A0ABP0GFA4_CLALP